MTYLLGEEANQGKFQKVQGYNVIVLPSSTHAEVAWYSNASD